MTTPQDPAPSDEERRRVSRRRLLTAGLAAPLLPAIASELRQQMPWREGEAALPPERPAPAQGAYGFFTAAEAAFIEAAVARLIPDDALGPGALKAGVPTFIDRQLAGEYGQGTRWYMQGPWAQGEKTQGWQSRLTPAGTYRAAIREIDQAVNGAAGGKAFASLAEADQDAWLKRLEDGTLALQSVDAKAFFKLLWQNTLEGFWSDPIYGGNRDMAGWKLIGFPGARYDLSGWVDKHGAAYDLPPTGIRGRVEWIAKG